MNPRPWLTILSLLTLGSAANAAEKPNVVIILIDDLGRNDLGCYGSRYYRTPNVDKLAADGVRFSDAYAACPVCSPTRASILTGKYPARLHLTDWLPGRADRPDQKLVRPAIRQHLPLEEVTLAEALKGAGYVTGHVGKWHLGGAGFGPQQQGFDVNVAGDQTGSPRSYFAPFKDAQGRFMPGLEQAPAGEYLTDRLTTEAEKFIDTNRDRPFFLYFAHYAVHIPLRAKQEMIAKYPTDGRPGTQNNPIYAAMIESMDESVGRVVKKLADLGLDKKTLVVFTSDNGGLAVREGPNTPSTTNAPLREGKGFLYEGGIRVPLVIAGPGVEKPGMTSDVPVSSIDFFPTVLELCGVTSDATPDGVSIGPVLKGGPVNRDALYWHYPHYANQGGRPGGVVRAGDMKLIEFYENDRRELFDIKRDPGESRNLAADKPDVVRQLATKLELWRVGVEAQMPRPNPDYRPNPPAADGTITLHAKTAQVFGSQLRFEAQPHKDTLGFWTKVDDWASWDFELSKPGTFRAEVLQGCGRGQGGSEVVIAIGGSVVSFIIEDTGGFQQFKARDVGTVQIDKPGRHTLTVRSKSKAAAAVMDLRAVTLRPVSR
jgi:arylsulfatase A-like enzyme